MNAKTDSVSFIGKAPKSRGIKKTKKLIVKLATNLFDSEYIPEKVDPSTRPTNTLDKKPGDHEAKTLETLVTNFLEDPIGAITKRNLAKDKTKAFSIKNLPYYQATRLRELLSALAVQRPISNKHLKKILENFDPKKVQYVNVLKIKHNKKYYYYIIDGQHTAVTYGVLAYWGYFEQDGITSNNWLDIEVKCQVVEFDNFTFAREHFLGVNGDDKKPLAYFDKWKNYVLAKRQDSPNTLTKEVYEDAYAKQVIMESYSIIPIHEHDEENRGLPGAFTRVDLLKDFTDEEMHWWCQIHQWNWDDRSVDSIEVAPMINLRNKIKGSKSLTNQQNKDFIIILGNIIRKLVGSPAEFRRLTESTFKEWYKIVNPGEKIPSCPADASLALLLQIYYQGGGTFKNVSTDFMKDYTDDNYLLFHALPKETQAFIISCH